MSRCPAALKLDRQRKSPAHNSHKKVKHLISRERMKELRTERKCTTERLFGRLHWVILKDLLPIKFFKEQKRRSPKFKNQDI
jgi:hypothetical protein